VTTWCARHQQQQQQQLSRGPHISHAWDIITCRHYLAHSTGNESVPIQLAQCWFSGLAISNAKIHKYIFFQIKYTGAVLSNNSRKQLWLLWNYRNVDVRFENKFIVSFVVIFGTLSFPIILLFLSMLSRFYTSHWSLATTFTLNSDANIPWTSNFESYCSAFHCALTIVCKNCHFFYVRRKSGKICDFGNRCTYFGDGNTQSVESVGRLFSTGLCFVFENLCVPKYVKMDGQKSSASGVQREWDISPYLFVTIGENKAGLCTQPARDPDRIKQLRTEKQIDRTHRHNITYSPGALVKKRGKML